MLSQRFLNHLPSVLFGDVLQDHELLVAVLDLFSCAISKPLLIRWLVFLIHEGEILVLARCPIRHWLLHADTPFPQHVRVDT